MHATNSNEKKREFRKTEKSIGGKEMEPDERQKEESSTSPRLGEWRPAQSTLLGPGELQSVGIAQG